MLRNLNKSAAGRRILGTPNVGLIASKILAETASGDHGPGLLYDEAQANPGKQLRLRITSLPGSGTLTVNENGSFELVGTADGAYTIGYDWYADNLIGGSDVATVTVGMVSASAPGAALNGVSALVPGQSAGDSSIDGNALGATINGTSSINAGAGNGNTVIDAGAPGAMLNGSLSIGVGQAFGNRNGQASGAELNGASVLDEGSASNIDPVDTYHLLTSDIRLTTIIHQVQGSGRGYLPGEVAVLDMRAINLDGVAADPAALVLKIKPPVGPVAAYAYGSAIEVVRDAAGRFHADLLLTAAGQWAYRWELGAPNTGAAEGVITVQKSRVI